MAEGPPERPAGLTPEQVRRTVLGASGGFRECYEQEVMRNPNTRGAVTIAFSVLPDGTVGSASVGSNSLERAEIGACLVGVFRGLRFPKAEKPTNASFPFVFRGAR